MQLIQVVRDCFRVDRISCVVRMAIVIIVSCKFVIHFIVHIHAVINGQVVQHTTDNHHLRDFDDIGVLDFAI
ncbi:hypothetical protein GOP47_0012199 [Adiantum capillus-veneris]|uniref:Uncharacterized protein n=1 Tax=Adiantum capillus-veneris TaxID=13818 RepID=A0A9D4URL0_ADICA|nr:hypothetical protein GOP47_0012199 [Adiantum capillus-veneris]